LKKFSNIEEEIALIPSAKLIGAMELKTDELTEGLKGWAKEWKL
jgi:hypothetical protein